MTPGDVVLARLRDEDGDLKLRPALVLALLPGQFQSVLVCAISTRTDQMVPGWDEYIGQDDDDFAHTGLREPSTIRLSFLAALPEQMVQGRIGDVSDGRIRGVRDRLAATLAT